MAVLLNRQRKVRFSIEWVRIPFSRVESAVGIGPNAVTVVFLSDRAIRKLNKEWRNEDSPTDCLSFPAQEGEKDAFFWEEDYLGDIAISVETAQRQSKIYFPNLRPKKALIRELTVLFVHSILHLLGYDHQTPQELERMAKKENEILEVVFPLEEITGLEARETSKTV